MERWGLANLSLGSCSTTLIILKLVVNTVNSNRGLTLEFTSNLRSVCQEAGATHLWAAERLVGF